MNDLTQILDAIGRGDEYASEQLLPLIYQKLRSLAADLLAQESSSQTLEATALVHEAYVRLVDSDEEQKWKHRGHFFGAAAEAMRRILVENARRKNRLKHGAGRQNIPLEAVDCAIELPVDDVLLLDEAPVLGSLANSTYGFCGMHLGCLLPR